MRKFILVILVFVGLVSFSQPINDNPCNAIPLNVGSVCNVTDANNFGATATAGVPAPGCGTPAYSGGDVWFSAVCPASGSFTVMMTFSGLDNIALAMYKGSCSSLTLVTCDYDGIGVANLPEINGTGLTPGATYYFRVWNPPNNTTGAISICAIATSTTQTVPNNQDCLNAIPICQSTFTNLTSYSGTGNVGLEINSGPSCLGSGEKNDVWYQFTVQNSGNFCFAIDPVNNSDDYDWAVYNLTGSNCSDIYNNAALEVLCNFSGTTTWYNGGSVPSWVLSGQENGTTGAFPSVATGNDESQNEPCISVTAGQSFVLNISNFSSTADGFYLNFPPPGTAGMAVIYDNIPPTMNAPQAYPGCGGNQLFATFSENIKCSTVSSADFSLTGPGGPYTINGQIGSACSGGAPYENSFLLNFTPALTTTGVYTVCINASAAGSVLDACNNPAPTSCFTFAITAPSVTAVPANLNCNGVNTGSIVATGAGSASFTYQLNNNTPQASGTFTSLAPGTYTVKAIGSTGCPSSTVVTITQPPALTVTAAPSAPACAATGSASSSVSGGTPGYTYSWSPSGGSGSTATGLASGTYSVRVTDSKGCTRTVTTNVVANPSPSASLTFTNPTCGLNNGVVFITNTSPALPAQTTTLITSSVGSVSGNTVTGLGASSPLITLTNNFGCTFTVSTSLTNQPSPTNFSLTSTNTTCGNINGTMNFGSPVTGGTPSYSYAINGGAFSITAASTASTNMPTGTYSVTIKDANGCVLTKTTTITNIAGPTAMVVNTSSASCAGATGSATVASVAGGTSTYSYSIDNGAYSASNTFGGLTSGTHTLSVKDANGCTFSVTANVGVIAGITSATVNATTASCGTANGSATVTAVTGGVPTYSYSFDNGAFSTSSTVGSLTAGSHTVVVKDANTCTLTVPFTVLSLGNPSTSITNTINVSCFGGANGSFTVATPTGGAGAPFTYSITSPSIVSNGTGIFTGLQVGSYNVSVRDAAGCIATTSVTISQPTALTLTTSSLPAKCFGTATGTINAGGAGGTPTYSYNLNGGAYSSSSVFNNVATGIYNIGIKDANGCLATQTIQVTEPTALSQTITTTNSNCTAANGSATTSVSGGTSPYFYSWTGGAGSNPSASGLVAGNYSVTVTDNNGCILVGAANIVATISGTAIITGSTNITCFNANNGSLTAAMTGGTPNYSYTWTPSGGNAATASNLAAGTYTCFVQDNFGCTSSVQATLVQPSALSLIMNSNNVKCFGTATGTVSASGSGGVGPYTYLWPTIPSTLSTVSGVGVGTYSCTVTDFNNCSTTQTINVTQPSSITLTSTVTAANCNLPNGSATVTATGGVGGFTYNWGVSTGSVITNQLAGTYTVTVTDANGCSQILSSTIPNLSGPSIAIVSSTNVSCFGGSNGVATTSVTGGTGTLVFNWSPTNQVTQNATNLLAGVHTVTVTDQAGCVASTSVTITQPPVLTVSIVPTNPKCAGASNGFGVSSANGGTAPYTYTWTSGGGNAPTSGQYPQGNYAVTVSDALGCAATATMNLVEPLPMTVSINTIAITCFNACNGVAIGNAINNNGPVNYGWTGTGISPISTQTLSGLCAGTYSLLATDLNGCTASNQITINQPTQVVANISATGSITCNGGNDGFATVSSTGGTGSHSYQWSPSGGANATASGLTAGPYTVLVTDQNSCTATASVTIIQPAALSTTLTTTDPKCNGQADGTGNIAYSGGSGATTFLWSSGFQTGNFVNNLLAGPQTVTITSNGLCKTVLTFTLVDPAVLTAVVSTTNANCGQSNGRACVVIGGGTGALQSLWSNGVTTVCNSNIPAGAYSYTVTDANLCTAVASGLVNDIAGPSVVITGTNAVKCYGEVNGGATTSITGGTGTLSISWSGTSPIVTTQNVTTLNAGIHNITVIDAAGCIGTASVNITQPPAILSAIGSQTNVTCFGLTNGGANLLVSGGTPNYSYNWSPSGQISDILANVGAGTFTCTITDANLCTKTETVTITQPNAVVMTNSTVTNILCNGGANGQIATTVVGGSGAFSYAWTPAQPNSPVINGLTAGAYNLVVTDTKSCSISANFTIVEPAALASSYSSLPSTCGLANGSATVSVTGGTQYSVAPVYNVTWNTPTSQSGFVASGLATSNNWIATITDKNGCSIQQTVAIGSAPSPTITGVTKVNPSCFGYQDGSMEVNYVSGTPNYQVAWSSPLSQTITTASTTNSIAGVPAGNYIVTVTDNNGCTHSMPVSVTQPDNLILTASATQSVICFGQSTQLSSATSGGTSPYSYTWTPAGTGSGSGPLLVSPTSSTIYSVNVTDSKNCPAFPRTITIVVSPSLSITGTTATLCVGDSITLTPTMVSPGRGAPYNFVWSNGVSQTNVATTSIHVPAILPSPNVYTVSVEDGCTSPNAVASFSVFVNPLPVINFDPVAPGCAPLTFTLNGTSDGANDLFYWQEFGLTGNPQVVTMSDTGKHNVTLVVTNPNTNCTSTLTKLNHIQVYPKPDASFYSDPTTTSILNPDFNFYNTSTGAVSYYWHFGDPAAVGAANTSFLQNTSHSYSYVGKYDVHLVATSSRGCKDTARVTVEVTPDFAIYIPNTFTPDGNGVNDIFQPLGVGIDEDNYRLDIFDRWGELIYTSNNFRKGWDGTAKGGSNMVQQGVYVYKLMVYDLQGNKHPFVGHVTLLKANN